MWNGNGPLFRADWSLKPSGKVWMQKVFGDWWTETRGRSDENGSYQVRGFLGDYEVEAVQGGRRATGKVTLSAEGGERVLRLPAGGGVTERLVSSNPYTAGKLPEVISVAAGPAVDFETLAINPKDGQGLMAWSPGEAGQNRSVSRDMYARFNSAAWAGKRVEQASLRIRIGKTAEASSRVKIFVLSNRFVPQDGEAGLGWTADDLELGRAPGRDARDGDYRLGDAAVIYLGDMPANDADGDGWLTFSSTGLTLAAAQAGLPGLTVIVSNPVDHLPAQEVQLLLRTGKGR
jgi:hypothetical protein